MNAKLKIGHLTAYQPYPEIEPVQPSPRIDPQQPRDEQSRRQAYGRGQQEDQVRRRFMAMRQLIEKLKAKATIDRVDHATAETEMRNLGLYQADRQLREQQQALPLADQDLEQVLVGLRHEQMKTELQPGLALVAEKGLFPVFVPGLVQYDLSFEPLLLNVRAGLPLSIAVRDEGLVVHEKGHLRCEFRPDPASDQLLLLVQVLVGASEIDDSGRRALLYQRTSDSYALYADKQIDLSI